MNMEMRYLSCKEDELILTPSVIGDDEKEDDDEGTVILNAKPMTQFAFGKLDELHETVKIILRQVQQDLSMSQDDVIDYLLAVMHIIPVVEKHGSNSHSISLAKVRKIATRAEAQRETRTTEKQEEFLKQR